MSMNWMKASICGVVALSVITIGYGATASAASRHWSGDAVSNSNWNTTANWSDGTPLSGDTLVFSNNKSQTTLSQSTNTISPLYLKKIILNGSTTNGYDISGTTIHISDEITSESLGVSTSRFGANIYADAPIDIVANRNANHVHAGNIYTSTHNLYFRSYLDSTNTFTGSVSGIGASKVYVTGQYNQEGIVSFGRTTNIKQPVVVREGGYLELEGKTGPLTMQSGKMKPKGCSYVDGFKSSGGAYYLDMKGSPSCNNFGKMYVTGTVAVSRSNLITRLMLNSGYVPEKGINYILISNDGTDKIIGNFSGLTEKDTFTVGDYTFRITYKGGTGNDIVITRI